MPNKGVEDVLFRLRGEFIEQCLFVADDLEQVLNQVYDNKRDPAEAIQYIRREMHNLKGQGSTFGFPVVGMVAHRLEDFLSRFEVLETALIQDVNIYLDHIRKLVRRREPLPDEEVGELLRSLPLEGRGDNNRSICSLDGGEVMVATSSRLYERHLEEALKFPGCRMVSYPGTIPLLEAALLSPPCGVIVSWEMPTMSGVELATVFTALPRLRKVPLAILTSRDSVDRRKAGIPADTLLVSIGDAFDKDMKRAMKRFSL